MADPALVQTDLVSILDVVAKHLVDNGAVDGPAGVAVVCKGKVPDDVLLAKRGVLLRPRRKRIVTELYIGVGRKIFLTRFVDVYTRLSYAGDKLQSDKEWLRRMDAFEARVLDALLNYFPIDNDRNGMTTNGLVMFDGSEPDKWDDDVWGESIATYQIDYLPFLNLTDPPG